MSQVSYISEYMLCRHNYDRSAPPSTWKAWEVLFMSNIMHDCCCVCLLVSSTDTSLGKKEKHADVWSLTQRHLSTFQNKALKDRLVRIKSKSKIFLKQYFIYLNILFLLTVITGSQKAAVLSAVTRVEVLIESFRKKQPFTHFLSFPLNEPKIQEGFLKFKDDVLQQCSKVQREQ